MKNLVLALVLGSLASLVGACDGMPVDGNSCTSVQSTKSADGPCVWQVPAGIPCDSLSIQVNGTTVASSDVSVVCSAGEFVLAPKTCAVAAVGTVTASSCPDVK